MAGTRVSLSTTTCTCRPLRLPSGIPRNFVWGGGSKNSVEDREHGDLEAVAP